MGYLNYNSANTNWKNIRDAAQKYLLVMKMVRRTNVQTDREFQKAFNGFYRIRQRSQEFYEALFGYLEQNKDSNLSFEQVLLFFYNKFDRLEPSFSSKLAATVNPTLPIWDSEILNRLGLKAPGHYLDKKIKLPKIIELYDDIVKWYGTFLKTDQAKEMIKTFDEKLGKLEVTDIKKIDLILWQTRSFEA